MKNKLYEGPIEKIETANLIIFMVVQLGNRVWILLVYRSRKEETDLKLCSKNWKFGAYVYGYVHTYSERRVMEENIWQMILRFLVWVTAMWMALVSGAVKT